MARGRSDAEISTIGPTAIWATSGMETSYRSADLVTSVCTRSWNPRRHGNGWAACRQPTSSWPVWPHRAITETGAAVNDEGGGGGRPAERPGFPGLGGLTGGTNALALNGSTEVAEEEIPAATHWPSIPVVDLAGEWTELRAWVIELKVRFDSVDHHVVPDCWWQHNEHVEALAALRDHERASFSDMAPATAPVDWFRAFRDITALLRAWTGLSGCGGTHTSLPARCQPDDADAFAQHAQADLEARQRATAERAE